MYSPFKTALIAVFFILFSITLFQACSSEEAATSSSTSGVDVSCQNSSLSLPYTEGTSHTYSSGERTTSNCVCPAGETTSHGSNVPDWIKNNFCCVTTTYESTCTSGKNVSGACVKILFSGMPAHGSKYYSGATVSTDTNGDSLVQSSMPSGKRANPNQISDQNFTMYIPTSPNKQSSATATDYSAIGVAINGGSFFNNAAAPGDDLSAEIESMDFGNGHPTDTGSYHYHIEPCYLSNNDTRLIGVLMDGFPVFGQKRPEDSNAATCGDSITSAGHCLESFTPSNISGLGSSGIPSYRYHVLTTDPYIASTYAGSPGKVE